MKDDNHNGVPNYIEKLAAAGNKAWLWYAHNGFKGPLPDSAGPDAKLDIYVKALPPGVFGVTLPTTVAQGGSFMEIDNQLDMAHLAVHGSLQQTVAHELFHEFQLSYVPDGGIPHWAAEGSALAMQTYIYPQVVDAATFSYLDLWLNQPWRSLYDESGGCVHCYGGALFWRFLFGLGNHVVSEYFGRLYGYELAHRPILLGLQPLERSCRSARTEASTAPTHASRTTSTGRATSRRRSTSSRPHRRSRQRVRVSCSVSRRNTSRSRCLPARRGSASVSRPEAGRTRR